MDDKDMQIALLQAAGVAQAVDEQLDVAALAVELNLSEPMVRTEIEQLENAGLLLSGFEEGLTPILLNAGRQFLAAGGDVRWEILDFLPRTIDDLHTRGALIHAGVVLVDEFRIAIREGRATEHAAELVPPAFAEAVDDALALEMFAAAVALMVRLSESAPAGCVAEEIISVRLTEDAEARLEMLASDDELTDKELRAAIAELRGLFELFQDDDVLNLFKMAEPADAALAGHDPINVQMGVADQRIESWFEPFGGTIPTGYLNDS